jgi:membrane protein DedA with SNARE-associated domain
MDGRINAQEGRKQRQICGQKLRFRPTTTMISPLPSKVNNPPHLADFAAGSAYLHSKFGHRKLDAILNFFHKWGTSALAVSTVVPIPMPTSMLFAAAGASDYGLGRFLTVVMICRSARYTSIAIVADHYGRPFVRVLRHPSQYWGWLLLFAAVIFSLIMAGILLNRRLTAATTA